MNQQYDDDGKGALWTRTAWSGKATIAGEDFVFDCVSTGEPQTKFPSHRFSLHTQRRDDHQVYNGVLWRPKVPGKPYAASGHAWIGDTQWLVFAYPNDDATNPKAPAIRLSFLPKDDDRQANGTGRPLSDAAECPF